MENPLSPEASLASHPAPPPLVSVVMAVYNGAAYLGQAVDSILSQSLRELEFIIVDDASTDQTPGLLASYADPRLVLLRNPSNIGLTRSLNRGLQAARAPFIARQDADDVSLPGRLARQAEFLAQHPALALVGAACRWIDAEGTPLRESIFLTDPAAIQQALLQSPPFLHGTFMLRRTALADGAYDEAFPVAQDYDLLLRLSERWDLANLPDVCYLYRVHAQTVSSQRKSEQARFAELARQNAIGRRLCYASRRLRLSSCAVPPWVASSSRAWLAQRCIWWSAAARYRSQWLALRFLLAALLLDPLNPAAADYLRGVARRKFAPGVAAGPSMEP